MDKVLISNSNFQNPHVGSSKMEDEDEDDDDVNHLSLIDEKKH